MISDKSYNTITKTVDRITGKLKTYNIEHEVLGDKITFAIAPTCTIHTRLCTIDVWKDEIKVNERSVKDIDEMIDMILEFE